MTEETSPAPSEGAPTHGDTRGHWGSRLGFILAASGSAVGLGNIWKFPYIAGENGGGLFVFIYLVCIGMVGLPIMIGEVMIGRATQKSPVPAFGELSGDKFMWKLVGWMGVVAGFVILSYYSVVAGWAMHYTYLSLKGTFTTMPAGEVGALFGAVYGDVTVNMLWHTVFMLITIGIVAKGISGGIEKAAKVLMPVLFVILGGLMIDAMTQKGFGPAVDFLFGMHSEKLSAAGVLEALGHSFFTLSLGMGAMLTYGSYLHHKTDMVKASIAISGLDTAVALMACLVLYPIIFSFGMEAQAGPGLVFVSIPISLAQMTAGGFLCVIFFFLLVFAALTSAISLLEVVVATLIDQLGVSRHVAAIGMGGAIFFFGIPSALSGSSSFFGETWSGWFGKNWFDSFDYLASNWFLPLGGLLIAVYVGWFMEPERRKKEFSDGTTLGAHYPIWLFFIRYVCPIAITILFLYSVKIIQFAE
jgi:NSS family neurotransmitter:Na+ symporter